MADSQENKQKEQNDVSEKNFMIEKIKERPVNKKKLLRRTLITVSMAVIFGLVACFTFLVLEPVISNWLYPEEEPQVVVFPEDQDEMSPEQMLAENMQQENQNSQSSSAPGEIMEQEQIRELLSGIILDLDNYKQIYSALAQYVAEMNRSMVTVTGVSSGVDWFNNVNESKNQSSGVIIAQNGKQLLILTDYSPVKQADDIIVTFNEGTQADASLKEKDETTGLAVIAIELDTLNEDFLKNDITIATLGSSNIKDIAGLPVVALGRPMGTNGSLGYGIITSSASESAASDTTYRILQTNIVGSQNAGGVLFNLQGQVIGIITNGKSATDMKNMVCAYGITELKRHIEKMSNGEKFAYLGLKGVDVTEEANSELGVPYGAYIKEVEMDSPAMLAGIQQGDVITGFGERMIISFDEYTNSLLSMKPGDSVELTIMRQSQQEYKEMKFIKELKEGDRVFDIYLCKHKQEAVTKNGKPYESMILQDKTGTIDAKVWEPNNPGIGDYDDLDYIEVYGDVTNFQGQLQISVKRIRVCHEGEYNPSDYLPVSSKGIDTMYNELKTLIGSIKNTYLHQLLQDLFIDDADFAKKFCNSSAAKTVHHGFVGGLLEHTLSVTKLCDYYCSAYPILQRDLLLTAAMCHDIGKVKEIFAFPVNDYTDDGQLLGHIVMGAQMLGERAAKIDGFPHNLLAELQHCILAHHGKLEYGSPKVPALIEAVALNYADDTDAKMETFKEILENNSENSGWLGYNRLFESNLRATKME